MKARECVSVYILPSSLPHREKRGKERGYWWRERKSPIVFLWIKWTISATYSIDDDFDETSLMYNLGVCTYRFTVLTNNSLGCRAASNYQWPILFPLIRSFPPLLFASLNCLHEQCWWTKHTHIYSDSNKVTFIIPIINSWTAGMSTKEIKWSSYRSKSSSTRMLSRIFAMCSHVLILNR